VRASPVLGPVTLYLGAVNLVMSAFETAFLVFLVRDLHLGPGAVGLVLGLGNVGLVLGAATSSRLARRLGIGPVLVLGAAVQVVGLAVPPLTRAGPVAVPVLVAGQVLFSTAVLWFNVQSISLRQTLTPEPVLGRVNAAVRLVGFGTIPLGSAAGGLLADALGLRPTMLLMTAAALLVTGLLLRPAIWRTRTAPPVEPLAVG
jgi:MFS family permease